MTITAKDAYGNNCVGSVTLTSSDGQAIAVSPANVTLTNGTASATVTLKHHRQRPLRATVGGVTGSSSTITVAAAAHGEDQHQRRASPAYRQQSLWRRDGHDHGDGHGCLWHRLQRGFDQHRQ